MLCSRIVINGLLLAFAVLRARGTIYKVDRKYITQVHDDVIMEAYYKDVDVSITPVNVSWYRHEKRLLIKGNYRLSRNKTLLTIEGVALDDAGRYRCKLVVSNQSTFITDISLVVHKNPLPIWAVALIIVGLIFLIIGTIAFFRCRKEISDVVRKRLPKRRKRTYTCETSFQE